MLRAVFAGKDLLRRAAERLPGFREPALIVWAKGDRVMPPEHGRRLAGLLPQAQLIEIDDSYALIPLDQPARPAQLIADFTRAPGSTARSHPHQPRPLAHILADHPQAPACLAARATAGRPSPARQQAKPGGSLDGSWAVTSRSSGSLQIHRST
jgi:hypothetical protein